MEGDLRGTDGGKGDTNRKRMPLWKNKGREVGRLNRRRNCEKEGEKEICGQRKRKDFNGAREEKRDLRWAREIRGAH
jgi:hypothetical protein